MVSFLSVDNSHEHIGIEYPQRRSEVVSDSGYISGAVPEYAEMPNRVATPRARTIGFHELASFHTGRSPSCILRLLSDRQPHLLMRQPHEKPDTSHTSPESFFETPLLGIISSPGAKSLYVKGIWLCQRQKR